MRPTAGTTGGARSLFALAAPGRPPREVTVAEAGANGRARRDGAGAETTRADRATREAQVKALFNPLIFGLYAFGTLIGGLYSVPPIQLKRFPLAAGRMARAPWEPREGETEALRAVVRATAPRLGGPIGRAAPAPALRGTEAILFCRSKSAGLRAALRDRFIFGVDCIIINIQHHI